MMSDYYIEYKTSDGHKNYACISFEEKIEFEKIMTLKERIEYLKSVLIRHKIRMGLK